MPSGCVRLRTSATLGKLREAAAEVVDFSAALRAGPVGVGDASSTVTGPISPAVKWRWIAARPCRLSVSGRQLAGRAVVRLHLQADDDERQQDRDATHQVRRRAGAATPWLIESQKPSRSTRTLACEADRGVGRRAAAGPEDASCPASAAAAPASASATRPGRRRGSRAMAGPGVAHLGELGQGHQAQADHDGARAGRQRLADAADAARPAPRDMS